MRDEFWLGLALLAAACLFGIFMALGGDARMSHYAGRSKGGVAS